MYITHKFALKLADEGLVIYSVSHVYFNIWLNLYLCVRARVRAMIKSVCVHACVCMRVHVYIKEPYS